MQALDGWLKAVRADGLVLMRTRVAGPWGYAVEPSDAVVFHFDGLLPEQLRLLVTELQRAAG